MTFLPASRVATSSPAANTGSASSQPSRGAPAQVELALGGEFREGRRPGREPLAPRRLGRRAALAHAAMCSRTASVDREGRVGVEPHDLLRRADLGLAERRAVRLRGVDRVRGGEGDVAADDDDGRARVGLRGVDRGRERVDVLRVGDVLDVPALSGEARALVLGVEAERRRPVDRDPVVVVEDDEAAEPELAGDRGCLLADALHQVAVRDDRRRSTGRRSGGADGCSAPRGTGRRPPCPTAVAIPCPSGPVVVSIPAV